MNKSAILDKIVDFYTGGNYAKFAQMLGIKYGTVQAWKYRNSFDVDIISTKCKEISQQFILTGKEPMLASQRVKTDPADKITQATNELLIACAELKNQISDIRKELEEERRQHQATTALLNRILDLYTSRLDIDYVKRAEYEYRTLAAEAEQTNTHEAV